MASKTFSLNESNQGMLLAAIVTACILWLSATHKLSLYISTRYIVFTTIMAALCLVAIVGAMFFRHREALKQDTSSKSAVIAGVCASILGLALLIIQPAALTSTTALQRGINSGGLNLTTATSLTQFGPVNYSQFTLRDWASILGQINSSSYFQGKTATLSGFVSPTPTNDPNVFYVSRFVITCCAMDAQPVGVPVYAPHWKTTYPPNSWVSLSGGFIANPDKNSATPVLLQPSSIVKIPEPQDPYVH